MRSPCFPPCCEDPANSIAPSPVFLACSPRPLALALSISVCPLASSRVRSCASTRARRLRAAVRLVVPTPATAASRPAGTLPSVPCRPPSARDLLGGTRSRPSRTVRAGSGHRIARREGLAGRAGRSWLPSGEGRKNPEMREAPVRPGPPSRVRVLHPLPNSLPPDDRLFLRNPPGRRGDMSHPHGRLYSRPDGVSTANPQNVAVARQGGHKCLRFHRFRGRWGNPTADHGPGRARRAPSSTRFDWEIAPSGGGGPRPGTGAADQLSGRPVKRMPSPSGVL